MHVQSCATEASAPPSGRVYGASVVGNNAVGNNAVDIDNGPGVNSGSGPGVDIGGSVLSGRDPSVEHGVTPAATACPSVHRQRPAYAKKTRDLWRRRYSPWPSGYWPGQDAHRPRFAVPSGARHKEKAGALRCSDGTTAEHEPSSAKLSNPLGGPQYGGADQRRGPVACA